MDTGPCEEARLDDEAIEVEEEAARQVRHPNHSHDVRNSSK